MVITRLPPEHPASQAYNQKIESKGVGRPRKRWIEGVKDTLQTYNMDITEAAHLALDRKLYLPSTL